jgi:tetratricopeptide (TPR) repeat protein
MPSILWAIPKERADIRAGNKDYKKGDYAAAEIDYRRALDKVATSLSAKYNLGNALLKQIDTFAIENSDEAIKGQLNDIRGHYMPIAESGDNPKLRADAHFNIGNTYLMEQDWKSAVEAYKKALRLNPSDVAAKENLVFAQAMTQNPPPQNCNNPNPNNNDKQDNKDKDNKNNNQPNPQDQNEQEQEQKQQQQQSNISKEDAQRMLQAMEQQEKETQDKVKKEKARTAKKRTSEKNW